MITKNELAQNLYNTITIYKKLSKKFQDDKMKKTIEGFNIKNLEEDLSEKNISSIIDLLGEYYLEDRLLSIISDDKQQSIKNIEISLEDINTLNDIESLIEDTIDIFPPLNEIDNTVLFFYDKVSRKICKNVIIEKFDTDYLKYWNLYVLMQNLGDNIIKYRKTLTS